MQTMEAFRTLVEEIHTIVLASVNEEGNPITCALDLMDYDEEGIYFLTARGKNLYTRLRSHPSISLTGMKGKDTLSCKAVSLQGKVKEVEPGFLERLFSKNTYMRDIYPTPESQQALTVFKIVEGQGGSFDLSKKPIERFSFQFGAVKKEEHGYHINENCIGCGSCRNVCPQQCIHFERDQAVIEQEHCLHCGNCMGACPVQAVERT